MRRPPHPSQGSPQRRPLRRRPRAPGVSRYTRTASQRLTRFRQATRLAVTATAVLLFLVAAIDRPLTGTQKPATLTQVAAAGAPEPAQPVASTDAVDEATSTIRELFLSFYALLPKILIALGILLLAYLFSRLARRLIGRRLGAWPRADALGALASITLFLVALGAAASVLAGDVRALVGAVGLAGLALSWALQTPIESFTGWLLNAFKSYYRVGDRIAVGDIFGDVYRIDVLTTTVWEAGGPDKPVQGAQPTGALVTFPNAEVLRASVVNYTRDFPYIWDEVTVGVANESDLSHAIEVVRETAAKVIGPVMEAPAKEYARLLEQQRLDFEVDTKPAVYVSLTEGWTNLTIRYLVAARERRMWSTKLLTALGHELARPEHAGKLMPAYPRMQVEIEPPSGLGRAD